MAWAARSSDEYQAFIDRYDLSFPQVDDTTAEVFTRFGFTYQPAMAFVSADGEVQAAQGVFDESIIVQGLE